LGDLGKYSRRTNDRHHQRRLKGGERIFKAYELDLENTLEVISEEQLLFRVRSESCHIIKHNVSIQSYFCDCTARCRARNGLVYKFSVEWFESRI
jgi:hypothetical protein